MYYQVVYFDIAVQVGITDVEMQKSRLSSGRTLKPVKACSTYNPSMSGCTKPESLRYDLAVRYDKRYGHDAT